MIWRDRLAKWRDRLAKWSDLAPMTAIVSLDFQGAGDHQRVQSSLALESQVNALEFV